MTILENTGELRRLAAEIHRIDHDPRHSGSLDFVLAAAGLAALFTVGVCSLILTFAPDEYPVEPGRVLLTMAAAGTCVFPLMGAMYGVNRANRKRFEVMMEKLDKLEKSQPDADLRDVDRMTKEAYDIGRQIERRRRGEG